MGISRPAGARPPAAAGRFYPSDPAELARAVDRCVAEAAASDRTDGAASSAARPPWLVVAPHAGIAYSGAVAARALRELARGEPRTAVLLGSAHFWRGDGVALSPHAAFATPLGDAAVDEELRDALARLPGFVVSEEAHEREHSVENLLPFLLRLRPGIRIVPAVVACRDAAAAAAAGRALAGALRGTGAVVAVSSDLSHYPSSSAAAAADRTSLAAFAEGEPEVFWRTCDLLEERAPGVDCAWCGRSAAALALAAAAASGAAACDVLARTNSGETGGEPDRVVGYAAVALRPGPRAPAALSAAEGRELLSLAREALSRSVRRQEALAPGLSPNPRLNLWLSAFVSLHRRGDGELRACLGSLEADKTLAEAVAWAAHRTAFADGRFRPVAEAELPELRLEVSVLSPLRRVRPEEVRPGVDGLEVEWKGRRGLLLPQMWGALPSLEEFLGGLCEQKIRAPRDAWRDGSARLRAFEIQAFAD